MCFTVCIFTVDDLNRAQAASFTGALIFILFTLLLIVFSANSGHDATDGIRLGALVIQGMLSPDNPL